jgi:3',5'-cyclic AMP phosphodiesterase CpdA
MTRRRLLALVGLAALALMALVVALAPPASVWDVFVQDRPAAVMGDPVPSIAEKPQARLAIAGDTGTGDARQRATAAVMVAEGREHPFDALILLGDLIYEDGDARRTRSVVIEPFQELLERGAELIPALGNHDYGSGEQLDILRELGRRQPWYVEWVGPVRVVVLDSNRVEDDAQTEWLRSTLAASVPRGTWTVAALHHPPYSAGYHGSEMAVRREWSDIFAQADVPLVLAGHDHDYQRSTPQDGVTYVVSGAGAKVRPTGAQGFTAVSASERHFLDLLVHERRLVGRAIDQSGRLLDEFSIER